MLCLVYIKNTRERHGANMSDYIVDLTVGEKREKIYACEMNSKDDAVGFAINYMRLYHNVPFGTEVIVHGVETKVSILDYECYDDGYAEFIVNAEGQCLRGLFRVYAPEDGDSMKIVEIRYGYAHQIIEEQWEQIEALLRERSKEKYCEFIENTNVVYVGMDWVNERFNVRYEGEQQDLACEEIKNLPVRRGMRR